MLKWLNENDIDPTFINLTAIGCSSKWTNEGPALIWDPRQTIPAWDNDTCAENCMLVAYTEKERQQTITAIKMNEDACVEADYLGISRWNINGIFGVHRVSKCYKLKLELAIYWYKKNYMLKFHKCSKIFHDSLEEGP